MINTLEFSNAKQVRKTLLVFSLLGLTFERLVSYSTGYFEFFGFKIPIKDASFIPSLIGYIIIYFFIALIIRYAHESFRRRYYLANQEVVDKTKTSVVPDNGVKKLDLKDNIYKRFIRKYGILFLDIIFPLLFALVVLCQIFFKFPIFTFA